MQWATHGIAPGRRFGDKKLGKSLGGTQVATGILDPQENANLDNENP